MEISELAPLVLIDSKNVKRQVEDLSEDQIVNQKTNKNNIKQTVHHPEWDQTEDQKEYKRLNGNKKDIKDLTWDQTKKKATCEIEDRVANKSRRFPCKYCNQTFSKNIYAISHEKKSCKKSKSKQSKLKNQI